MVTKIIPAAVASEQLKDEVHIGIDSMSITYIQPADTNSARDELQTITVSCEDGSCVSTKEYETKGVSGMYLNIKTDRWSVDEPEDFEFLLNDFKQRLSIINSKES